MEETIPD